MSFKKNGALITVENVNLKLGEKQILRDINLVIHDVERPNMTQGQVVSFVGRSGIGKTQLFRILAGLNQPDTGKVLIGVDQHPVQAGEVGVVPQNYVLFNHRTVRKNLEIALERSSVKEEGKEKLINDYAEHFDLKEQLDKYPMQLSGGQRQRVSIIQQVLTGNRFILFDEPFSGLDILMVDRVLEILLEVSKLHEHNTLVIVSHDIENAVAISDTVFLLNTEAGKPGATIAHTYDLCAMDLAWEPDIRKKPEFHKLIGEIRGKL